MVNGGSRDILEASPGWLLAPGAPSLEAGSGRVPARVCLWRVCLCGGSGWRGCRLLCCWDPRVGPCPCWPPHPLRLTHNKAQALCGVPSPTPLFWVLSGGLRGSTGGLSSGTWHITLLAWRPEQLWPPKQVLALTRENPAGPCVVCRCVWLFLNTGHSAVTANWSTSQTERMCPAPHPHTRWRDTCGGTAHVASRSCALLVSVRAMLLCWKCRFKKGYRGTLPISFIMQYLFVLGD